MQPNDGLGHTPHCHTKRKPMLWKIPGIENGSTACGLQLTGLQLL